MVARSKEAIAAMKKAMEEAASAMPASSHAKKGKSKTERAANAKAKANAEDAEKAKVALNAAKALVKATEALKEASAERRKAENAAKRENATKAAQDRLDKKIEEEKRAEKARARAAKFHRNNPTHGKAVYEADTKPAPVNWGGGGTRRRRSRGTRRR